MSGISLIAPSLVNQSLNQSAGARAAQDLKSEAKGGDKQKIEKSAKEFESILIGQWLEQAEKSFATVPGDSSKDQTDPGHDQLQGIAMQSLAQNLTKAGGLGIASMIVKGLEKTQNAAENSADKALRQVGGSK